MKFSFSVVIAALMLAASPASAQALADPSRTTSALEQTGASVPVLKSRKPEQLTLKDELESFAPQSPGDDDLGQQFILRRKEHSYPWHFSVDNGYFYTDNAANAKTGKISDWFFVGGLNAAYQPRIGRRVFLDLSVGQHWFLYDRTDALDFQSGEASAGFIVVLPELASTLVYANYYYQRLTHDLSDSPIYANNAVRAGAQKTFLIDRLNSCNVGMLASFALDTDPQELKRNEYSFTVGYSRKIMRGLFLNASYRLGYYDYYKFEGRKDWYHTGGLALTYSPTEWLEISASYNYTFNNSSKDAFDYQTQLAGPAITLRAKF